MAPRRPTCVGHEPGSDAGQFRIGLGQQHHSDFGLGVLQRHFPAPNPIARHDRIKFEFVPVAQHFGREFVAGVVANRPARLPPPKRLTLCMCTLFLRDRVALHGSTVPHPLALSDLAGFLRTQGWAVVSKAPP